jgi:hypothetical protein
MVAVMDESAMVVEEEGTVVPTVYMFFEGLWRQLPLPFEDRQQKEFMFFITQAILIKLQPEAALFVSEAWTLSMPAGKADNVEGPVSDHPDKNECLWIFGAKDRWTKAMVKPIIRDSDGKPSVARDIEEFMEDTPFDKLFAGVFKPKGVYGHA